jgi:acetyltransferase
MAIVSQSGTVGAALIDWASQEQLGFSAFVSLGNRVDVDEADLISFFAEDTNTKVVALYIEGVKDAPKFLAAAKRCTKPIVILKAGRTQQGRKAAESHTRSLAGRDEIYDAVFRQHGIHRANTIEELYDFAKALAYVPPPAGKRVLILTSSGGSAILATDVFEEEGFRLAPLPGVVAEKLREFLPPHCIVGNPLDLTGDGNAAWYRKALEAADGHYDVVMTIFGDPIPDVSEVVRPGQCELVAYLGGADVERAERIKMHERKIAVFPTPERAVRALACHTRLRREWKMHSARAEQSHAAAAPASLPPAASMAFVAEAAIPVTPFSTATTEDEAVTAAVRLGFPVALKVNSPDVTHKSDVGGVVVNVLDEAGVRAAFRKFQQIETTGRFRHGGALVCAMAAKGLETIIGVTRDPQFGHAIMFGVGGTLVEVMKDVSFRIAPLSPDDAFDMINETKGAKLLAGLRGAKPADTAALRDLLVRVSELVTRHPEIEEMDLNPVFVYEQGVIVADARVALRAAGHVSAAGA